MTHVGGFLDVIVASDPQGQAFRFLVHLLRDSQATGGALLVEAEKRPRIWMAVNVARPRLADWPDTLKLISGSGVHAADGLLLAALRADGELIGVVQLEGAAAFDTGRHGDVLAVLAKAIVRATQPRPASYSPEDLIGASETRRRDATLHLLEHREWNIAKVARDLGVTRRTIYTWLDRWRIPRQKVPKR